MRNAIIFLLGIVLVAAGCADEKKSKKPVRPAKESLVEQRVVTENGAPAAVQTVEQKDDYIGVLETRIKMTSEDARRYKNESARYEQEVSQLRIAVQQHSEQMAGVIKERDKAQGTAQYLQNRVETLEKQGAFYYEKWKALEANPGNAIVPVTEEPAIVQPAPMEVAQEPEPVQPAVDDERVKALEKRDNLTTPSSQNPFTRRQFSSMIFNMSKDDLTSYLGQPDSIDGSVYTYNKAMTYAIDKTKTDSSVRIFIENDKVTRCGFDN